MILYEHFMRGLIAMLSDIYFIIRRVSEQGILKKITSDIL